jgi:hypothetical protein
MSVPLVSVIVAISRATTAVNTQTGAAFASTSVTVTDSTGTPQAAVILTGKETPTPWAFSTSVAPGTGSVTATDLDVNGAALGAQLVQTFTEAGSPPTFFPATGISVTPVTAAVAAASAVKKA